MRSKDISALVDERRAQYGTSMEQFAAMVDAYLRNKLREGETFDDRDGMWTMLFMKAARDSNQRKQDNIDDAQGYIEEHERRHICQQLSFSFMETPETERPPY